MTAMTSLDRLAEIIATKRAELIDAERTASDAEARRNSIAAQAATGDVPDSDQHRAQLELAEARQAVDLLRGTLEGLDARLTAARIESQSADRLAAFKASAAHAAASADAAAKLQDFLRLAGEQAAILVRESRAAANAFPQDLVDPSASSGIESFIPGAHGGGLGYLWATMWGELYASADGAVPQVPGSMYSMPAAWRHNQPALSDVFGRPRLSGAFMRRGAPADVLESLVAPSAPAAAKSRKAAA